MANSIEYWYDIIIAEKNTMANLTGLQPDVNSAQTLLRDVKSTSRVARWRLWAWCFAVCAYSVDVLFDLFKLDLEAIAMRSRFGTLPWYSYVSKKYQHGYNLVWKNNNFEYAVVDEDAMIIKRAASIEVISGSESYVTIKVATLVSDVVTKLSDSQKAGFTAYIGKQKPGGMDVRIISDDPDELRVYLKLKYDPLVLKNTGESILESGVFPVEDAINDYISNLPFNGKLELCDLEDKIQEASGVVSVYITLASARYGANPFVVFTENYVPNAGHLVIDPTTLLSSTITYAADV